MRTSCFPLLILLMGSILMNSCSSDSGIGQFDSLVIEDEDNPYKFQQLTFTLSLKDSENGYLNLDVVDSLSMFVNAKYWGVYTSGGNDTLNKTDRIVDQLRYSDKPIEYLFIAPYVLKTDNFETAGDFVEYLNNRIILTPGEYICELNVVKFKTFEGNWITKKIQVFVGFDVIQNTTSAYMGKIEVTFNE